MGLLENLFGPPSKRTFAKALMAELRNNGDSRELVYDEENFRLIDKNGNGECNLGNVYQEHCSLPRSERPEHLQRLGRAYLIAENELPDDFLDARLNLRPKIWTRATFANIELRRRLAGDDAPDIPMYLLGSHLYSSLVYDMPHSMRSLSSEDLDRWGVSYYEAMEAACENLAESTMAWSRIGDGFHAALTATTMTRQECY